MLELRGGRALVTGGATRVGRSIAIALADRGMNVAVHFHTNRAGADTTVALLQAKGVFATNLEADLSEPAECRRVADQALGALGGLDLLVCNAASFEKVSIEEAGAEDFEKTFRLNTVAGFVLAQAVRQALAQTRGSVVCITCATTTTPMRNYLPYVTSKAALKQLVRALALELAPEVRVNAVAPGTVLPPTQLSESELTRIRGRIPLGRFGTPEDVADAVLYLASAPFVTGQEITVDGGRSVAGFEAFG